MESVRKTEGQKLFDVATESLNSAIGTFPDSRSGHHNTRYSLKEIALGAFSVFFMRSESFLEAQRMMETSHGLNNLRTMFGVDDIPTDNHIRSILDGVSPAHLDSVFSDIFYYLDNTGHIERFRCYEGNLLLALDGTQYHSSKKICCANCTKKEHRNGTLTYSHTVVTPVIVNPDKSQVISLAPEFIIPQDGHDKQDCEIAAAKRLIERNASHYRDQRVIVLGDDLYCCQPFCQLLTDEQLEFILVCKPTSHKVLYGVIDELDALEGVEKHEVRRKENGKFVTDTYRFANNLALRGGNDAMEINWCEIITTDKTGKILYINSFATSLEISAQNVADICANGRARWKVENENNNTLKNLGYNLEHNFGHGSQHLSSLLATFNIIAFLMHTAMEIVDEDFQQLIAKFKRSKLFKHVAVLTCYICFGGWQHLLRFMTTSFKEKQSPPTHGQVYFHPDFPPLNNSP